LLKASDAIHANAQGYAAFTRGLVETLRKSGLLAS
jgi:lysophospholipase L1-like esterase